MFDTLYYNANIITVDKALPRAKWAATKDGKIAAVGVQQPPLDRAAKAIDLGERTVLPGFIDSHAHGVTTGFCMGSISMGDADLVSIGFCIAAVALIMKGILALGIL